MRRLILVVEGPTEETFVKEVLAAHLYTAGFHAVGVRLMGSGRARANRGGVRRWESVRHDVLVHLKEDPGTIVGVLVDYYGMPDSWPGRSSAAAAPVESRSQHVERELVADVARELGGDLHPLRFLPCVLMHEFEALLFSDPSAFAHAIGVPECATALEGVRAAFQTPEHINDSPLTAPSKRIAALVPGYQKPIMGTIAALDIGLDVIRRECAGFARWMADLESAVLPSGGANGT
ncbi:MAG: DUF4276 family protein [Gemmatimonadota bacterium]|nr:DUF4276 family protein [Gemmatimonadota bacterium]